MFLVNSLNITLAFSGFEFKTLGFANIFLGQFSLPFIFGIFFLLKYLFVTNFKTILLEVVNILKFIFFILLSSPDSK